MLLQTIDAPHGFSMFWHKRDFDILQSAANLARPPGMDEPSQLDATTLRRVIEKLTGPQLRDNREGALHLCTYHHTDEDVVVMCERGGLHMLVKLLLNDDEDSRGPAALALVYFVPLGTLAHLIRQYDGENAVRLLLQSKRVAYQLVGCAMAGAIAEDGLQCAGVGEAVVGLVNSQWPQVRYAAAWAIARFADQKWMERILKESRAGDPAALFAEHGGPAKAAPAILRMVRKAVRCAALDELSRRF